LKFTLNQDFDDYDEPGQAKSSKRFSPKKASPVRNPNFRSNRPRPERPQVNANLNDEEVYYDEVFFDNEDSLRSNPQDNLDLVRV